MGEPATPTAQRRQETRELAARIVRSVERDLFMPHGLPSFQDGHGNRLVGLGAVEDLLTQLCQEICALTDAIRIVHEQVDLTDPVCPVGVALTKAGLERKP